MQIDKKLVRDTLVLRLSGELDMLVSDKLRQDIDQNLEAGKITNLIVNLEKVSFIDSSGLGFLLGRYKKMTALNGKMYIVGAKASVEKILNFSGINKLIPLYSNERDITIINDGR